ncbi:MAG: NAD(P)-dependent alcohol dehydrogenase [Clostridiaceae bacterium]
MVRIVSCGVCHTDEAQRHGGGVYPVVLGHEGSGVVEALGEDVHNLSKGDHVVLTYPSCGYCKACIAERPFDCEHLGDLFDGLRLDGTTPIRKNGEIVAIFFGQGSLATYVVCNIRNAVKVDKSLDLRILGPLGCGVQTGTGSVLNYLKPEKGKSIAIFGVGSVGLSAVMASKLSGCNPIIAVDIVKARLEAASEFGATHLLSGKDPTKLLKQLDASGGLDYFLETSGNQRILDIAVASLAVNGSGASVGIGNTPRLKARDREMGKSCKELIQGCSNPQTFIPEMISLYKEGKLPFDKLITFFSLEKVNDAFDASRNGIVIKPVVVMP